MAATSYEILKLGGRTCRALNIAQIFGVETCTDFHLFH